MALKASFMAAALAALFVANPSLAQDDSGLSVDDLSWIAGTCRGDYSSPLPSFRVKSSVLPPMAAVLMVSTFSLAKRSR